MLAGRLVGSGVTAAPCVKLISSGTTYGQARSDDDLAERLRATGFDVEVVRPSFPRLPARLRRLWIIDLWEAFWLTFAARIDATRDRNRSSVVYVYATTTATFFEPRSRLRRAILRFDALACENRTERIYVLSRLLERRSLRHLKTLCPMADIHGLPRERYFRNRTVIPCPPSLTNVRGVEGFGVVRDESQHLCYVRPPEKKGFDVLCRAWLLIIERHPGLRLLVLGISEVDARGYLTSKGLLLPRNVEFPGSVSRAEMERLMLESGVFVSTARREDFGMSQMEALRLGMLLVTTRSFGGYQAMSLAEQLPGALVTDAPLPEDLSKAVDRASRLSSEDLVSYRGEARRLTEAYTAESLAETVDITIAQALRSLAATHRSKARPVIE